MTSLKEDGASLGELAPRLGYQSEAAFSRAFKRFIGVSPGGAAMRASRASDSVNRQSKLSKPRGLVPVTALKLNPAANHMEKSASAQRETPACRRVSEKLAEECATTGPLNDGPFTVLKDVLDPERSCQGRREKTQGSYRGLLVVPGPARRVRPAYSSPPRDRAQPLAQRRGC